MCTLTWETFLGGYELHFNRDESRTRRKADPPKLTVRSGVSVIAPRDSEAGGTWISLNEAGVSLCLLNNYDAAERIVGHVSRGMLVDALSTAKNSSELNTLISALNLSDYSAFDLFVFSPKENPLHISWDGVACKEQKPTEQFASSSGVDTGEVILGRLQQYIIRDDQTLTDFHRSHLPSKSAYSVCMHRPDAETQSYTRIQVNESQCQLWYTDGPPCEAEPSKPLHISRLNTASS